MENTEEILENIKRNGKSVRGRGELIRFLKGNKLTRKKAMLAKCYDCMGYYSDGRQDCKITDCPLYPWNPSAKRQKNGKK